MVQTFVLQPLWLQNVVMSTALGIVVFFLLRGAFRKNKTQILVFSCWLIMIFWFFNGPFWGFSALTVSRQGIVLHYGWLSLLKNGQLPLASRWQLKESNTGFPRYRKLYYIEVDGQKSMRLTATDYPKLQEVARALCQVQGDGNRDCH